MAITRCPYCHAIIDETDKYCNNCGTQLLFPDEDAIEEEIPGEKILDAETEEKDYEIDEPGKVAPSGFVDEEERESDSQEVKTSELDEALAGEPPDRNIRELIEEEEPTEEPGEEDRLGDVILVDEIAAQEAGGRDFVDEEEELIVGPEARTPTTAVIPEPGETAAEATAPPAAEPAASVTEILEAAVAEPPAAETPAEPFRLTAEEPETESRGESRAPEPPLEEKEETRAYLIHAVPLDEHELESDEDESPAGLPLDEETAEIVADETAVPEPEAPAAPPAAEPAHEPTPVTWHEPTPPPMRDMEPEPEEAAPEGGPAGAEPLSKPITFDTGELEGIGKTIDLSKARLDSLIEEMAEDREIEENLKPVPPQAQAPKQEPIAEQEAPGADYIEQAVRDEEPHRAAEPEQAREPEPARELEIEPASAAAPLLEEEMPAAREPDENEEEIVPALETKPFREPEEESVLEGEPVPKTGTLPPWASRMKGRPAIPDTGESGQELSPFEEALKSVGAVGPTPGLPEEAPPKEATPDAEVEIFPRQKMPDSGIGLPERITQAALPFEETSVVAEEGARPLDEEVEEALGTADVEIEPAETPVEERAEETVEAPARRPAPPVPPRETVSAPVGEPAAAEIVEKEPRPPFSLSLFVKSKGFDLLLVAAFWLVAMWVAARSLGSTLFEILGASPTALIVLFVVLVGLYFFLFKFFLGETLGDRLFRAREPAEDE